MLNLLYIRFSGKVRQNQVFFAGNMGSNLLRYEKTSPSFFILPTSMKAHIDIWFLYYLYVCRQTVQQSVQGDSFFRIVSGRMDDKDYTYMLRTSQFCLHLRGFQVCISLFIILVATVWAHSCCRPIGPTPHELRRSRSLSCVYIL